MQVQMTDRTKRRCADVGLVLLLSISMSSLLYQDVRAGDIIPALHDAIKADHNAYKVATVQSNDVASAQLSVEAAAQQRIRKLLFKDLAEATDADAGHDAEAALWRFWFSQAPTPEASKLLHAGIERRDSYDYEAAENLFDQLLELAPDYTEGYNQRAFARFLRQNYTDAKADLEKVLTMEPDHFGALSGLYHIHVIQGRGEIGFDYLKQAVVVHPWLKERSALPEDMRPAPPTAKKELGSGI